MSSFSHFATTAHAEFKIFDTTFNYVVHFETFH